MKSALVAMLPVFVLFGFGELAFTLARDRWRGTYRPKDTLANVTLFVVSLALAALFAGAYAAIYARAYAHRVFDLPRTWWVYALLVVAEDLAYYAYHRVSHESRFWWAAHETHHSSRHYNLAVAGRQPWTGFLHGWIFWLPLPLLGFAPEWVFLQQGVNLAFQFFLHTRLVRRLGPLEWVLNTPSHHRVHHGVEVAYLDANYGGTFIVWDRLFGTFVPEAAEPTYGLVKQLETDHPVRIATDAWRAMARDVRSAPTWRARLKYVFGRPGWRHDAVGGTAPEMQAAAGVRRGARWRRDGDFAARLASPGARA